MRTILLSLLALFLIVEEWLWDILTALGHRVARWLHLARVERWLSQTSPAMALVAFAIPLLIVTPINLAAFWMLAQGLIMQGIVVEVFAKLLGTLLVARVFALTRPQLLTFAAFARVYHTITGWLYWAHERVRQTLVYRTAQRIKLEVRARFNAWVKDSAT